VSEYFGNIDYLYHQLNLTHLICVPWCNKDTKYLTGFPNRLGLVGKILFSRLFKIFNVSSSTAGAVLTAFPRWRVGTRKLVKQ
jgi:hypothetical protein